MCEDPKVEHLTLDELCERLGLLPPPEYQQKIYEAWAPVWRAKAEGAPLKHEMLSGPRQTGRTTLCCIAAADYLRRNPDKQVTFYGSTERSALEGAALIVKFASKLGVHEAGTNVTAAYGCDQRLSFKPAEPTVVVFKDHDVK